MAEFVQGFKDVYGRLHKTEQEADSVDLTYFHIVAMQKLLRQRIPIALHASPDEMADYIVRNYGQIKLIMDTNG